MSPQLLGSTKPYYITLALRYYPEEIVHYTLFEDTGYSFMLNSIRTFCEFFLLCPFHYAGTGAIPYCFLSEMFTIKEILFCLLLFIASVESIPIQDAEQVNSTTNPEPGYELPWVAGPPRRGTLDILFACILTLLLCVWTTVHTNIEPEIWQRGRPSETKTEYDELASPTFSTTRSVPPSPSPLPPDPDGFFTNLNYRKMIWSVVTLLFPEIALFVAAHERKTANLLLQEMKILTEYKDLWNMTLSYYAVMGGFVVEQSPSETAPRLSTITEDEKYMSSSSYDNTIYSSPSNTASTGMETYPRRLGKRCTLTPLGVLQLAQSGELPHISEQTVRDKSKASLLAKFLVCFQGIWMIIQVIGRYGSRLPVTLLELYTVLHTFCAVAMYLIWIDKPFDISEPTFIKVSPGVLKGLMAPEGDNESSSSPDHNPTNVFWHHEYTDCLTTRAGLGKLLFRQLWDWHGFKEGTISERFLLLLGAYIALWNGWKNFGWEAFALSIVGMVHGGLHLVAWEFNFPTRMERRLWKIASVLTAGAVAIFCFSVLIGFLGKLVWDKARKKMESAREEAEGDEAFESLARSTQRWKHLIDWLERSRKTLLWWCMVIYCIGFVLAIVPCILARLYLLVEAFVSMRQLPYHSYDKVVWASFLPHVG